jgi:hypothetical protein
MTFVVVNLASEYLPDGSFHVYSPDVPGFHVIDQGGKRSHEQIFRETALPVLEQTLSRRVLEAQVGKSVRITNDTPLTEVGSFVPNELRRRINRDRPFGIPKQLIAQII